MGDVIFEISDSGAGTAKSLSVPRCDAEIVYLFKKYKCTLEKGHHGEHCAKIRGKLSIRW
jgi:hypothetical protein